MADEGTFIGEVQRGWRRFWRLSWWWKGPILGVAAIISLSVISAIATGGTTDEPPTYLAGSLTVTEPADGATIDTEEIVIRGTAPPGAEVRRDIRGFKKDDKFNADANGKWEYRTKLDEGDNEFNFFLQDAKDVKAKLTIKYAPPVVAEPTESPSSEPTATASPEPATEAPAATAQPETPTPIPTLPPDDVAGIEEAIRMLYQHYDEGSMVEVIRYVSTKATQECGGALNHASAYVELKQIEGLRYEVREIHINRIEGDTAQADVRLAAFRIDNGEEYGNPLLLGFDFVREVRWVHTDDPLPVKPFCG